MGEYKIRVFGGGGVANVAGIDFEFGRSIGATHYNPNNGLWYRENGKGGWLFYRAVDEWINSFVTTDNTGHFIQINHAPVFSFCSVAGGGDGGAIGNLGQPEPWSIHNNDKPLNELSDEQKGALLGATLSGGVRQVKKEGRGVWSDVLDSEWYGIIIYRIKPKSERDTFIEAAESLIKKLNSERFHSEHDISAAIFDAIQRGDIKAPEVKK